MAHDPSPLDPDPDRRAFLAWCGKSALLAAGVTGVGCPAPGGAGPGRASAQEPPAVPPRFPARDFGALRGLTGITDEQVEVHLELYQGYVRRLDALATALDELRAAERFDSTYQELKRRLGFEWDGARLHELYFEGLKAHATPLAEDSAFARAAAASHGSLAAWRADLLQTARMPGVGWVVTTRDADTGNVLNAWIDEHQNGHLAGHAPLLVLDVWEHAFSVYRRPTERAAYLEDLLANVDWDAVTRRMAV